MTKTTLLKTGAELKPQLVQSVLGRLAKQKLTGEFAIETETNAYWLKLWCNKILDVAPVLRDKFFKCDFRELLTAIGKNEGSYAFYSIQR